MQSFVAFLFFLLISFPIHGSSDFWRSCSNTTFSPNSTYLSNLKILSSTLSSNASHKLYHNSSVVGRPPNPTTYGDFQCRGDLNATACRQCVTTATSNSSQKFCPFSVEAVVWFDECALRYSSRSFFSILAETPSKTVTNVDDVDDDVDAFDKVVVATLNATARNASHVRGKTLKFATKEVSFKTKTVYTLAQCTEDLSTRNCGKCLRHVVAKFPDCCSGKKGARILTPSCTVRYELYPFYGGVSPSFTSTPPAPPPAPIAPPPPDLNPSPAPSVPSVPSSPSPPAPSPAAPSVPSSPSAPAPSTAAPPLLSGKGGATVAMVIGVVLGVAGYFL